MVAYAGLNPSHHRSGTSIDRPTRISKIGSYAAVVALHAGAVRNALQFNPAVAALVAHLKSAGRLQPKQIVVAAMRKFLVLCFGVSKTGKRCDPAIAMPALSLGIFLSRRSIGAGHSAVPICRPVGRREQRRSRRAAGPRAIARLVLDCSEHAGMLCQIDTGVLGWTRNTVPYREHMWIGVE